MAPVTVRAGCATHVRMGAPANMQANEFEDVRHHRAFLLYAMQRPDDRSLRAVARALSASDNSIRKWRDKEGWDDRLGDPESCRHAVDLYAQLYHTKLGGREVSVIAERLGSPYVAPDEKSKSEVARAVDLYEQVDRESAVAALQQDTAKRNDRLKKVLDGTLARVGQGLASGEIKPRPSDIGVVVRGYELIEQSEARRLAMLPSTEDGKQRGGELAVSQRVLQAEQNGGDVIGALIEDAEELLLILRTLQTHEAASNVIPFKAAKRAGEGNG